MPDTGTDRDERVPGGLPAVSHESIALLLASSTSALAQAVLRVRTEALRSDHNYAAFGNAP